MKMNDFVRQLNYPTRKIDGNFILSNKPEAVLTYIDEADAKRSVAMDNRNAIITQNKEKVDKLLTYLLEEAKVDQWKIFKQKKRGKGWMATTVRGDMYTHWKKVFEDVKAYVPLLPTKIVDFGTSNAQYVLEYNNVSLTVSINRPHSVVDIFAYSKEAIKRYEESVAKENKHLTLAKEFLDNRKEDYSELITAKDIIALAEEISREEYRESVFADGETIEVQHSDGEDCEWDGCHRCECGNNRYYLEIEGNLVDGYYSYGQWC